MKSVLTNYKASSQTLATVFIQKKNVYTTMMLYMFKLNEL